MISATGDNAGAMLRDFARFARIRLLFALGLIALGSVFEAIGLLWLVAFAKLLLDSPGQEVAGLALLDPLLRLGDSRTHVGIFGRLGKAGERAEGRASRPFRRIVQHALDRDAERLTKGHAIADRRRHAVIRQHDEIVLATCGFAPHHAQDLRYPPVGASEITERLPARRPEVMGQLVVREAGHPRMRIDGGGLVLAAVEGDRLVEVFHNTLKPREISAEEQAVRDSIR